jgi:hypothetical protein
MKKLLIAICLGLVVSSSTYAQYNTGDSELNSTLRKIDGEAKVNFTGFKNDISITYNVPDKKITSWSVEFGLKGGDIYMVVEISKITRKSVDEVVRVYQANKKKGWGAIAKELGIKPGSPEFHALKNGASSKANKAAQGNAKGKGKKKG